MIVATAGHVDHGKTSLLKALTGTDTDRLPEEKSRGLSIDLGFAYQSLPDNTILGFVDVPGHEKFIRNMLAGVGGIDMGLLVVAADDGVMPQTREHFFILDLLGIRRIVVAISKIDRVEASRIDEVRQEVELLLGKAGHTNVAMFPVCAPDETGIDALRRSLTQYARNTSARSMDGYFRMAIDRAFILSGVGLVVTGMVHAGSICIEDKLVISSSGAEVRIRGIRAHNEVSDCVMAGQRCAINIVGRGIGADSVQRGDWLIASELYLPTRRIDVELRVLESEPRSLKHWTPVHLHIGTDHKSSRVAVLEGGNIAPGKTALVQLVLQQDTFAAFGDRIILRDQSAQRTIAGGQVIDPYSPKRGRARPDRIVELKAMNHQEHSTAMSLWVQASRNGLPLSQFSVTRNLTQPQSTAIAKTLSLQHIGPAPNHWLFDPAGWEDLLRRLETAVSSFHEINPTLPGASVRDLQLTLKPYVEDAILDQAILTLVQSRRLARRGSRIHLSDHEFMISDHDRDLRMKAESCLAPDSGSPMSLYQTAETLNEDRRVLEKALKSFVALGEIVVIARNRYVPIEYLWRAALRVEALASQSPRDGFTVTEYCEKTTIGRNFAIALLEYFDQKGFTQRSGNNRKIRKSAEEVFADIRDTL